MSAAPLTVNGALPSLLERSCSVVRSGSRVSGGISVINQPASQSLGDNRSGPLRDVLDLMVADRGVSERHDRLRMSEHPGRRWEAERHWPRPGSPQDVAGRAGAACRAWGVLADRAPAGDDVVGRSPSGILREQESIRVARGGQRLDSGAACIASWCTSAFCPCSKHRELIGRFHPLLFRWQTMHRVSPRPGTATRSSCSSAARWERGRRKRHAPGGRRTRCTSLRSGP